jgi:transcriptional regulator with XRE-family HTH domain
MTPSFGDRLRQLRGGAGLSQERLAALSGLSSASVYALEGGRASPTFGTVLSLSKALGTGLAAFDGCTPPPRYRAKVCIG